MTTSKELIQKLETLLNETAMGLPKVSAKKMFGCHALFADDKVFALVWKHGQIGVKLTDENAYEKLMAIKGTGPWKAGPMQMAHWVLVPESLHRSLKSWLTLAHAQALVAPAKAKAKKKPVSSPLRHKKPKKKA